MGDLVSILLVASFFVHLVLAYLIRRQERRIQDLDFAVVAILLTMGTETDEDN